MTETLFRREVLEARQGQWLGTILLTGGRTQRLFALFAALAVAGVVALLFTAEMPRRAHLIGWLMPREGLARVFAPQPGVVSQLLVHEGQRVRQGQTLMVISTELRSASLGATSEQVARTLQAQRLAYQGELQQLDLLQSKEESGLRARIRALTDEESYLTAEIAAQQKRLDLARANEAKIRSLREQGIVSDQQMQQSRDVALEHETTLKGLQRTRARTISDRAGLEGELAQLPFRIASQKSAIERSTAQIDAEIAEAETRRGIAIVAPQSGTVSSLQVERGGRADTSAPLLSIVPNAASLVAQVFAPSRAIGFLRPGQLVYLQYDAFPYQRFGHHQGRIGNVSRAPVSPAELPQQLTALSSPAGEPLYRITVDLPSQSLRFQNERLPLQPGMRLEADVVIERRKLITWIIDPLLTVRSKWNQ